MINDTYMYVYVCIIWLFREDKQNLLFWTTLYLHIELIIVDLA
jgi:hypothetical protein